MQGSRGIRRGRGALDLIRRLAVGLRRHEHAHSFAWRATGAGNARIGGLARSAASGSILSGMPVLKSRIGEWELDHLHAWSEREERMRSEPVRLVDRSTKVATIGSCFAHELAKVMGTVDIQGGMHPGGLFYSTATIRQELERICGGWPERQAEPLWDVGGGFVDPFRDYDTKHADETALLASRSEMDAKADALFTDARVIVVTLGLIETWRSPVTGNTFRQIPHPAVFPTLGAIFHRLTVAEMLDDLERI